MRVVACALAAVLAYVPCARAETAAGDSKESTIDLRVRFAEGTAYEAVGRWADALERFESVARARPTPEVQFHVGLCHEQLGRLRQAEQAFEAARRRARGVAPAVEMEAAQRLRDLDARIPRLVVAIAGEREELTLLLDGKPIRADEPQRVDPGPHVAVAVRRGTQVAAIAFSMQERRAARITLPVLMGTGRARAIASFRPPSPVQGGGTFDRVSPIARATPSR